MSLKKPFAIIGPLIILSSLLLASCGYLDSEQAKLKKITKLFEDNKFNQVIISSKQILQANPKSCEARILLGKSLFAKFSLEDAHSAFQNAQDSHCTDPIIFEDLFKINLYRNRFANAKNMLSSPAYSYGNKAPEKFRLEGDMYFLQGQYEQAKEAYNHYFVESKDAASNCLNQAKLSMLRNDAQSVILQTRECESKYLPAPGFDVNESRYLRGIAYLDVAKTNAAKKTLALVISKYTNTKNPNIKIQAALQLMRLYASDKRLSKAAEMANIVLNYVATPDVYYVKGLADLGRNQRDLAEAAFLSALQLNSNHQPTLLAMARLKYQEGNVEQAKYYANRVDVLTGNNHAAEEIDNSLALKYYRSGNLNALIDTLSHDNSGKSQYLLALAYAKKGQFKAAMQTFSELQARIKDSTKSDLLKAHLDLALKNRDQAISIFEKYAKKGNIYALSSLVDVYISTHDYAKAELLLKHAINNKNNVETNLLLAKVYAVSNEKSKLLTFLGNLERENPGNLYYKLILAKTLFAYSKYQDAIVQSKKITSTEPNDERAYFIAAESYLRLGQIGNAIDMIDALVSRDRHNIRAYLMLSNLAMSKPDNLSALAYIDKALDMEPDNLAAIFLKIKILARLDRRTQALKFSKLTAEKIQDKKNRNLVLGYAELNIGNTSQAYQFYKTALELGGNDVNLAFRVYRLSLTLSNAGHATEEFERFLKSHPESSNLFFAANRFMEMGDAKLAEKYYTAILKQGESSPVVYNNLALLKLRGKDRQAALNYANQAIKLAPQSPEVMDTLGQALLANNNIKQAKDYLLNALKKLPDNPSIKLHVAQYYYLAQDYKKSKSMLLDIIPVNFPENEEARRLLESVSRHIN